MTPNEVLRMLNVDAYLLCAYINGIVRKLHGVDRRPDEPSFDWEGMHWLADGATMCLNERRRS